MGVGYLIIAILDLLLCILFGVQASMAVTDFQLGSSIFCAICWGICFVLNLITSIRHFID